MPGFFDKRVGQRGNGFRLKVEEARCRSWAAAAAWEDDYRLLQRRLGREGPAIRIESAWKRLRARDQYLSGEKSPSRGTVEELSTTLPTAYDAYNSLAWKALNPQTDLEGCANLCVAIERDLQLGDALERLASLDPSAIAPQLANGRVVALLVATIRRREDDEAFCFGLAQALLRAILALALAPGMRVVAEYIWDLVCSVVVARLARDGVTLRPRPEHFSRFLPVVDQRLEAVKRATGRLGVAYHLHPYPFALKLTLFWPLIHAFTAEDANAVDRLQDLLSHYEPSYRGNMWLSEHPILVHSTSGR